MATTTTNLGLTKPSGTDKIRIAQINGNMDILDDKIGAVGNTSLQAQVTSANQAISNISSPSDLGSCSSESNLATALDTKISAMSNGTVASIRFQISSATDNFSAYAYVGTLTKISSQYASMTVAITTSSGFANVVTGSRNNTWVFKQLALKSDLAKVTHDITPSLTPLRCDYFKTVERAGVVTMHIWNLSFANSISTDTVVAQLPYTLDAPVAFIGWERNDITVDGFIGTDGSVTIRKYAGDLIYASVTFCKKQY